MGPSSAPPEFGHAAAAETSAKLDGVALVSRAAQPGGPHSAKAPEARRDQVATPSASARAAWVGAAGGPVSAGAGAPPDPKRGLHEGARDGREPQGVALETQAPSADPPALLPSAARLSGRLAALAETAKDYARSAQADNTQRAYS
ncbi:MAG TPA: hypothetical protein VIJ63_17125, partial [Roseiarcus sp.]